MEESSNKFRIILFKSAIKSLESGKHSFICNAIGQAENQLRMNYGLTETPYKKMEYTLMQELWEWLWLSDHSNNPVAQEAQKRIKEYWFSENVAVDVLKKDPGIYFWGPWWSVEDRFGETLRSKLLKEYIVYLEDLRRERCV